MPRELTTDELRKHLCYDSGTGVFTWKVRGKGRYIESVGSNHKKLGYQSITVLGKKYLAHRLAWLYVHGQWPLHQIDHINGNKLDNRICNLRDATPAINSQNQRKPVPGNKVGRLGVSMHGTAFRAQIKVNGKRVGLGCYHSKELAHSVYIKAKRYFHEGCTV